MPPKKITMNRIPPNLAKNKKIKFSATMPEMDDNSEGSSSGDSSEENMKEENFDKSSSGEEEMEVSGESGSGESGSEEEGEKDGKGENGKKGNGQRDDGNDHVENSEDQDEEEEESGSGDEEQEQDQGDDKKAQVLQQQGHRSDQQSQSQPQSQQHSSQHSSQQSQQSHHSHHSQQSHHSEQHLFTPIPQPTTHTPQTHSQIPQQQIETDDIDSNQEREGNVMYVQGSEGIVEEKHQQKDEEKKVEIKKSEEDGKVKMGDGRMLKKEEESEEEEIEVPMKNKAGEQLINENQNYPNPSSQNDSANQIQLENDNPPHPSQAISSKEKKKKDKKDKKSKKNKKDKLEPQQNNTDHQPIQEQHHQNEENHDHKVQVIQEQDSDMPHKQQQTDQQDNEQGQVNSFYEYIHPYLMLVGSSVIESYMSKKPTYKIAQASNWATQLSSTILLKAYFDGIDQPQSLQSQTSLPTRHSTIQTLLQSHKFYRKLQHQLASLSTTQSIAPIPLSKVYFLMKRFKIIASCLIMEKKQRTDLAINVNSSCYWNKQKDGQINFSYDGKGNFVMLTLYGLENNNKEREI